MNNHISLAQYDSSTTGMKFKVGVLQISTTNSIVRDLPYTIILRGISYHGNPFALDASFLLFTKNVDLPIITGITSSDTGITIYPNPCTNELHFARANEGSKVEIFDELGKRIQGSFIDSDGKIETSQLPAGLYIVTLEGNSNSRFKIIKR